MERLKAEGKPESGHKGGRREQESVISGHRPSSLSIPSNPHTRARATSVDGSGGDPPLPHASPGAITRPTHPSGVSSLACSPLIVLSLTPHALISIVRALSNESPLCVPRF